MTVKKKITVMISVLTAFIVLSVIFLKPVYYRLYLGDRIQGNVRVLVDNEVCPIDSRNVSLEQTGSFDVNSDGTASVSFHGGEYGGYRFSVANESLKKPVTFTCFQHNWWNVQTFDINMSISTSDNTVTLYSNYKFISDDGNVQDNNIMTKRNLTDDDIQLFIGL